MKGYANLAEARDLREIIRLDDLREQQPDVQVEAVVLTTHDLNLRFVLAELLPGFLSTPDAVPPGLGPGHRTFRSAMIDLPDTALVYAYQASHDCGTPWRPTTLHVCPYRGLRRQHSKIAAILYRDGEEHWLRLVASSANLTRRGFATNLEAGAFEDYHLGEKQPKFPSLYELRQLLLDLAANSTIQQSRAYEAILDVLPMRRGQRSSERFHFIHTAEPREFRQELSAWLRGPAENAGEFVRSLVVSPFFSVEGPRLREFAERDLRWARDHAGPIDLVLDGRQLGDEHQLQGGGSFSTPPAWFHPLRGDGSGTFRPAIITQPRGAEAARGSGQPGRPLHAKLIGAAWRRKRARTAKHVWRLLIGSSNFSEGGLGLADRSSIEAGFLVEHEEDVEYEVFGPRSPVNTALCLKCSLAPAPGDRVGPDLGAELASNESGRQWLVALDHASISVDRVDGRFVISVRFPSPPDGPLTMRFGSEPFLAGDSPGHFHVTVDALNPYCITVIVADRLFAWPLPTKIAGVWSELIAAGAGQRRVDRLLEFWLAVGSTSTEPDDDDLDFDGTLGVVPLEQTVDAQLGSWRLNRLVLGLRRRLAESVSGIKPRLPPARALLGSVRVQELLKLAAELAPKNALEQPAAAADLLYFSTLARAALLGYHAAESSHKGVKWTERSKLPSGAWKDEAWIAFESQLADCRQSFDATTITAIDAAAGVIFDSVRDGEIAE